MGYCKDHMSVRNVKHVSFNFFSPTNCVIPAASRTEPVFAAMINLGYVTAFGTGIDIDSQSSSAANPDCIDSFVLLRLNKFLRILFVDIPPLVKEVCKAILLFTIPVMFPFCMNSTFTHAAIVYVRLLLPHTIGNRPEADTNLHRKLKPAVRERLFSDFYLV